VVLNIKGGYESLAYQTGNEYVVEIAQGGGSGGRRGHVGHAGVGRQDGGCEEVQRPPVTFNFRTCRCARCCS
jgi:type IV pilus assembly protein PilQ